MGLSYRDLNLSSYTAQSAVAVGVSGGPDSMALAWLLKDWAFAHNIRLHLLTIDHGLRAESADEARMVADAVKNWPGTTHHILNWEGEKPDTRLLEAARTARYALMRDYCTTHNIHYAFVAHHQDDQAETFLMRLAKGSGLDGLAAMRTEQPMGEITLVRPLLNIPKEDLVALCDAHNIPYVRDPTNEMTTYLRPRLRAVREALEQEGLTSKRLSTTAARFARARDALDIVADFIYNNALVEEHEDAIVFDRKALFRWPDEFTLRVVLRCIKKIRNSNAYPPRLEKVEELAADLRSGRLVKTVTLGGCLFITDLKSGTLRIEREV